MTAFTTISDALVQVGAKPFATTIQALRDNLLSAFEGDSTAVAAGVTLQFAALGAWYTTAGGVGTYVFATRSTATDVAFGGSVAGSDLLPTSAMRSNAGSSGAMNASFTTGSALSGTWQCMGTYDHAAAASGGGSYLGATLWLRVS